MTTYRVQLTDEIVAFLTEPGGTLYTLADHVRDGEEYGQPGWTYLDSAAIGALRELPADYDGHVDDARILWIQGTEYQIETAS